MTDKAVFIVSYQRPDKVFTYELLKNTGYKGKIFILISDDDKTKEEYLKIFGKNCIVFSKENARKKIDLVDNFEKRNLVVFARNELFEIAKKLGLKYFCVLDDDYRYFKYRRIFEKNDKFILKDFLVKNINGIINKSFDFLKNTPLLDCFAWSQCGDFIGGWETYLRINGKRKIMNAFFFKTDKPIRFKGSINEDLNASVYEGQRGKIFFTINDISIDQIDTQQNDGGLTDIYLDLGTYIKSFYSVIVAPNCVKISAMGNNDLRIHHKVSWNKACPKIIREKFKTAELING